MNDSIKCVWLLYHSAKSSAYLLLNAKHGDFCGFYSYFFLLFIREKTFWSEMCDDFGVRCSVVSNLICLRMEWDCPWIKSHNFRKKKQKNLSLILFGRSLRAIRMEPFEGWKIEILWFSLNFIFNFNHAWWFRI